MSRYWGVLVISALVCACGSDPQPTPATSANDVVTATPGPASAAATASGSAGLAVAQDPKAPLHAAGDPTRLLEGGLALESLPTRATAPGRRLDPQLRLRLMATPTR